MSRRPPKPEGRPSSPRFKGKHSEMPRTLRDVLKDVPTQDEQAGILLRLGDVNVADEAAVLVGGALLEHALKDAITRHFRKGLKEKEIARVFDFDSNGPLATFSAKIKLSYLLGIGGKKTNDDLDNIRVIRNVFAHTPRRVSFEDDEVVAACDDLHVLKDASLLSLAGLSVKQKFVYAIFQYHMGLRTYGPNSSFGFHLP
jgi:DNA-binding MltR family transcriptional regulator